MASSIFDRRPSWTGETREVSDRPFVASDRQHATRCHVYFNGEDVFSLVLTPPGGLDVGLWTDEVGLEAIVMCAQAALVRARIQRDAGEAQA